MKKILAIMLAGVLALAVCACAPAQPDLFPQRE